MSSAGASADREYERRSRHDAEWRRRNRARGIVLTGLAALVGYAGTWLIIGLIDHAAHGAVRGSRAPSSPVLSGGLGNLIALVFACLAAAKVAPLFFLQRRTTTSWRRGALGEQWTARAFAPLTQHGYVMLHDRRIPGSRANIDHVLIGPTGIFVVESKNYRGRVVAGNGSFKVNGRRRNRDIDETLRETESVAAALRSRLAPLGLAPRALICVHSARVERASLLGQPVVRGVRVASARRVTRWIVEQPRVLTDEDVRDVARFAEASLAPA